jgi:hypothetical protein
MPLNHANIHSTANTFCLPSVTRKICMPPSSENGPRPLRSLVRLFAKVPRTRRPTPLDPVEPSCMSPPAQLPTTSTALVVPSSHTQSNCAILVRMASFFLLSRSAPILRNNGPARRCYFLSWTRLSLMARVLLSTRDRLKPLLVHIYSDDNRVAAGETSTTATVQNFKTSSHHNHTSMG